MNFSANLLQDFCILFISLFKVMLIICWQCTKHTQFWLRCTQLMVFKIVDPKVRFPLPRLSLITNPADESEYIYYRPGMPCPYVVQINRSQLQAKLKRRPSGKINITFLTQSLGRKAFQILLKSRCVKFCRNFVKTVISFYVNNSLIQIRI